MHRWLLSGECVVKSDSTPPGTNKNRTVLHDEKSMKCYVVVVIRTASGEIAMAVWMPRVEEPEPCSIHVVLRRCKESVTVGDSGYCWKIRIEEFDLFGHNKRVFLHLFIWMWVWNVVFFVFCSLQQRMPQRTLKTLVTVGMREKCWETI